MNKSINILIVDDEKTNIQYVSRILENKYTIKVAYNGEQALKILSKIAIDLVLLDIQMPIMDGYTVIEEMKKTPNIKNIPVIFLTSVNDDTTLIKVFNMGASDYITKPFNKEELKVRVKNHLNNYALQKEVQLKVKQINSILNEQDNLVILTDGFTLEFANKTFLEFFGFECIVQLHSYYKTLSDIFVINDMLFDTGKIEEDHLWIDVIANLPSFERIVKILSSKFILHAFSVNIKKYGQDQYIVTFTDISDTILNQIKLENKIVHDKLTNAFNREYFEQNYQKLLELYCTAEYTLAISMLDLDKFKKVNDNYGHDVGDAVLIHFVQIIKRYSREEDILVRWGGEEFIFILKVQRKEDLQKALDNLRKVIENENFPTIGTQTCSMGASLYRGDENIEKTIKRADEALYEAKLNGRNQVVIS